MKEGCQQEGGAGDITLHRPTEAIRQLSAMKNHLVGLRSPRNLQWHRGANNGEYHPERTAGETGLVETPGDGQEQRREDALWSVGHVAAAPVAPSGLLSRGPQQPRWQTPAAHGLHSREPRSVLCCGLQWSSRGPSEDLVDHIRVGLFLVYSVPLAYVSVFMLVPHYFDDSSL